MRITLDKTHKDGGYDGVNIHASNVPRSLRGLRIGGIFYPFGSLNDDNQTGTLARVRIRGLLNNPQIKNLPSGLSGVDGYITPTGRLVFDSSTSIHRNRVVEREPKLEKFPTVKEIFAGLGELKTRLGNNVVKSTDALQRLFQSAVRKARLDLEQVPRSERWMWGLSHVVPVAESLKSRKPKQALDLNNTQLFPGENYHKLFDKHFFTYASDGSLIQANKLTPKIKEHFSFDGRKIRRAPLTRAQNFYMAQHRAKVIA